MRKILTIATLLVIFIGCSRTDESSSTESSSSSSSQTTNTTVKMNVVNAQSVPKSGITVMMFKTKVVTNAPLPNIEKQVVSDANGLANFDLESYITSNIPQTYYFEAFTKQGNNWVLVSTIHPEIQIKKGTQTTTSIIVNN